MMHLVPDTRCISTPKALVPLSVAFSRGEITMTEHKKHLKSCIRLLCKKEPMSNFERIFIKFPQVVLQQLPLIHEMFPPGTFNFVFNARHPEPCLRSFLKVANHLGDTLAYKTGAWWRCHWEDLPRSYK